jgi:hypothetical protein
MIKRHDIRPRRKRATSPAGGRPGAPDHEDVADEGEEVPRPDGTWRA